MTEASRKSYTYSASESTTRAQKHEKVNHKRAQKHIKVTPEKGNRSIFFQFDQCIDIFIYPVKSVSQSEQGVDYTIQGLCFGFATDFNSNLNLKYSVTIK